MANRDYDVTVVGDFRQPICQATTIVEQVRAMVLAGYRVGIVQLKSARSDKPLPIHACIRHMTESGSLQRLDPLLPATSKLLLAADITLFTHRPRRALQLNADMRLVRVTAAPESPMGRVRYDWQRLAQHTLDVLGGEILWAPQTPTVRHQLADLTPGARLSDEDWQNIVDPSQWQRSREGYCSARPVIGRHGAQTAEAWPAHADEILALYPDDPRFSVRFLDGASIIRQIIGVCPRNWELLSSDDMTAGDFLATIDFFVHSQHADMPDPPDPAILEAMASGAVTILPPAYQPIFGEGAVYGTPDQTAAIVADLYRDRAGYRRQSQLGVETVRERFSPARHVDRLQRLIGPSIAGTDDGSVGLRAAKRPAEKSRRRVLFITINGVGMGHLTRMLAIAKRCPAPIEPVFLTMSQALKVVREQGFLAEYVPSRKYLDCDLTRWNGFLRDEVSEIISFYDPAAVLFDGNVPYQGVIDAIKAYPDPWSIWSRRGMWRVGSSDIVSREEHFDVVLEPGDLAGDDDHGITSRHRDRTRQVAPIRLLAPSDMLSREEARLELGLDLDQPAVLIQLGAGNNFDYRSIHKTAHAHVTERHGAQVAVGEWLISDRPVDLPDGVVRMPGYPFARYFNAFDLAISAVGYNSFHELLFAGLPTILVPNEAMEQDNQLARALYADRHGLAACVRTKEIYNLTATIDRLFEQNERQKIKDRLATLDPINGADEAATFIEEMVYSHRVDRE